MPNGVDRSTRSPGGGSLVDQSESASGPTYATPRAPILFSAKRNYLDGTLGAADVQLLIDGDAFAELDAFCARFCFHESGSHKPSAGVAICSFVLATASQGDIPRTRTLGFCCARFRASCLAADQTCLCVGPRWIGASACILREPSSWQDFACPMTPARRALTTPPHRLARTWRPASGRD
jgi:hypothetical protein